MKEGGKEENVVFNKAHIKMIWKTVDTQTMVS